MTEEEFTHFFEMNLESYVQAIVKNFKRPIDEVKVESKEQVKSLLKDGVKTKGHWLFIVLDKEQSSIVGNVWVNVDEKKKRAFLYDIDLYEPFRGKGYGRASLELLEEMLREKGIESLELHVFADNSVAIGLYKKLGYETTSYNMRKDL
jgi:ribosomal protein S18 acetylase RimI-like enzyme